jgi:hypothetical protein
VNVGVIRKNFAAMPWLLKLITLNAALGIVLIAATVAVPVNVYGREVAPSEWWSSGAGPVTAVAMALLFVSAYLLLERSAIARKLYLVSLSFAFATGPIVDHMVGARSTDVVAVVLLQPLVALLLILLLACYLYLNRGVQKYFERQS